MPRLSTARVLRVEEHACEVVDADRTRIVRFASMFPSPRLERVSPGHLVAVATAPQGDDAVVWRWYDAVVLGHERDGSVRLWAPGHGEVVARPRTSYKTQPPGSRAYASAGLPSAEWWVATARRVVTKPSPTWTSRHPLHRERTVALRLHPHDLTRTAIRNRGREARFVRNLWDRLTVNVRDGLVVRLF